MSTRARPAEARIRAIFERWFLTEPLLFSAAILHALALNPTTTMRAGRGRLEYAPTFVDALDDRSLESVLRVEATRIVLGHPYARRRPDVERAFRASNLALAELLRPELPMPRAYDVFGNHALDGQYFELYYDRLPMLPEGACGAGGSRAGDADEGDGQASTTGSSAQDAALEMHLDPRAATERTELWDADELVMTQVRDAIREAAASEQWGSLPGALRASVMSRLVPQVDYRAILRLFRANVLASSRRLTRMKLNRRYEHAMGSRRDFTTRLLFAFDTSGSMSMEDLAFGLGALGRFFHYGVERTDVIAFDTEVRGPAISLHRARSSLALTGGGGTSLDAPLAFIDAHRDYDGLVVLTDGLAPRPKLPLNRATRVVWLFTSASTHAKMRANVEHVGKSAFIRDR